MRLAHANSIGRSLAKTAHLFARISARGHAAQSLKCSTNLDSRINGMIHRAGTQSALAFRSILGVQQSFSIINRQPERFRQSPHKPRTRHASMGAGWRTPAGRCGFPSPALDRQVQANLDRHHARFGDALDRLANAAHQDVIEGSSYRAKLEPPHLASSHLRNSATGAAWS